MPIARDGMYYKEFIVQSDWMHHGEGLQLFNRMGLSIPDDAKYQERAQTFRRLLHGRGSGGSQLRSGPQDHPQHAERQPRADAPQGDADRLGGRSVRCHWIRRAPRRIDFDQFLAHYKEYGDVVGDHFLNLVATTLPIDAYLVANESKYKKWIVEYMDAWLDRMKQNGGIIPSFVDLDGRIGGPDRQWWRNAYGWGFSPVNPVTGRREDRNRIPRALVGFNNALLVTGDRKYVDAWRTMIEAVNSHARVVDGRNQYPTMYGADGWYGWRDTRGMSAALEVWYWSQQAADRPRVGRSDWLDFLEGEIRDIRSKRSSAIAGR